MNSSVTSGIAFQDLQKIVTGLSTQFGFDSAGVSADAAAPEPDYLAHWLTEGRGGEMDYLARVNESGTLRRSSLQAALPWARSVILCISSYDSAEPLSTDSAPEGSGWIARYAQPGDASGGPTDYHDALLAQLRAMEDALHQSLTPLLGEFQSRSYVDTGPLIERAFARYAGLGWIGKNTCLIDEQRGSYFFVAAIVTSLELHGWEPLAQLAADRCGTCTRCIDACPTNALDEPYRMNASRCIAYLTIEKKGSIAEDLREGIGRNVFGCDICQDVCPWNKKARREGKSTSAMFPVVRQELVNPRLAWLATLTPLEFKQYFRGTPLERTGWRRVMRNVAIAMGNDGREEFLPLLEGWSKLESEPALTEAAQWAMKRIRLQLSAHK